MSGISLNIGIDDANIRSALLGLEKHATDMTPLMDEIGGIVVADVLHNFETGTAPDGTAWEPSKRVEKKGGQTLRDQGHLMSSITPRVSSDEVEVGSNLVYAAIHQLSGKAGRNKSVFIPARPYLGISPDAETEILNAARDYMAEPIEGGRS